MDIRRIAVDTNGSWMCQATLKLSTVYFPGIGPDGEDYETCLFDVSQGLFGPSEVLGHKNSLADAVEFHNQMKAKYVKPLGYFIKGS